MKYFLHDTSSFDDDKITELFIEHGYEGLGLFYTILEKIGKQEKPIKTTVLKKQLSIGKKLEKCWLFLEEIGLISSKNGETFNERILSYSETYQIKKEKNKEKISQWRDSQQDTKNVTGYVTVTEPVRNPPKVNKVNKVNESKVNIGFEIFWDLYEKKVGDKGKLEKKWNGLTDEEREKAITHVPSYKISRPDKIYRKDPMTYLNNKSFNDEIISNGNNQTNLNTSTPAGKNFIDSTGFGKFNAH